MDKRDAVKIGLKITGIFLLINHFVSPIRDILQKYLISTYHFRGLLQEGNVFPVGLMLREVVVSLLSPIYVILIGAALIAAGLMMDSRDNLGREEDSTNIRRKLLEYTILGMLLIFTSLEYVLTWMTAIGHSIINLGEYGQATFRLNMILTTPGLFLAIIQILAGGSLIIISRGKSKEA